MGINSYLSSVACDDTGLRPAQTTFETVYSEIRDIGRIFGVETRAEALIYLLPFLFLGGALLWGWWSHRGEGTTPGPEPAA